MVGQQGEGWKATAGFLVWTTGTILSTRTRLINEVDSLRLQLFSKIMHRSVMVDLLQAIKI